MTTYKQHIKHVDIDFLRQLTRAAAEMLRVFFLCLYLRTKMSGVLDNEVPRPCLFRQWQCRAATRWQPLLCIDWIGQYNLQSITFNRSACEGRNSRVYLIIRRYFLDKCTIYIITSSGGGLCPFVSALCGPVVLPGGRQKHVRELTVLYTTHEQPTGCEANKKEHILIIAMIVVFIVALLEFNPINIGLRSQFRKGLPVRRAR